MPTYPFERKSYWFDPFPERPRGRQLALAAHPLLGNPVPAESDAAQGRYVFEAELGAQAPAYLGDHRIFGRVIFPAAGYLELAIAAATQAFGAGKWMLENVAIAMPLLFEGDARRRVRTSLERELDGTYSFTVTSRLVGGGEEEGYGMQCRGGLRPTHASEAPKARFETDRGAAGARGRCT